MEDKEREESKEEEQLDFLKEHVVKDIRKDLSGYVRLVLLIALLISVTALVVYLCLNSEIRSLSRRLNEKNALLRTTSGHQGQIETTERKGEYGETDADWIEEGDASESDDKEEKNRRVELTPGLVDASVVMLQYEWKNENGSVNKESKAGIIFSNDEKVRVLAYNTSLQKDQPVDVALWGEQVQGTVAAVYEDYKLAVVTVLKDTISEKEPENVVTAVPANEMEFNDSRKVYVIANFGDKKNVRENGRLTLKENTVSILDGCVRIADTDINGTEGESAFVFNERGLLLGFAGVDEFSGKISVIDIQGFMPCIDKILSNEKVPYIGIYGKEVTDDVVEKIDKEIPYGIYISNLKDHSPAYTAGIMNGDIIVSVAGRSVLNFREYMEALGNCRAGQQVNVSVMRKGKDGFKKINYEVVVGGMG